MLTLAAHCSIYSKEVVKNYETQDPTSKSTGKCKESSQDIPWASTWGTSYPNFTVMRFSRPVVSVLQMSNLSYIVAGPLGWRRTWNPCLHMCHPTRELRWGRQAQLRADTSALFVAVLQIIRAWDVAWDFAHVDARLYTLKPDVWSSWLNRDLGRTMESSNGLCRMSGNYVVLVNGCLVCCCAKSSTEHLNWP